MNVNYSKWEELLLRFVFENYLKEKWTGRIPPYLFKSIAANAARLSDSFTSNRKNLREGYLHLKESRSAYLLYFHLANAARTLAAFEEIKRGGGWPKGNIKVLDIGAGSAPSLWAAALMTKESNQHITKAVAWDRERKILSDAKMLWETLDSTLPLLETAVVDIGRGRIHWKERFDLIVCSNMLNELNRVPENHRISFFQGLLQFGLVERGLLVLIEPALQSTSRQLTMLRDHLRERMECGFPFPCGHDGECPLNREPRDWCHFETKWSPPPIRRRIEKSLDHASGWLKYSYLVIRPKRLEKPFEGHRVVSDWMEWNHALHLNLCAPGQKIVVRLDPRKSETKKLEKTIHRGDWVTGEMG